MVKFYHGICAKFWDVTRNWGRLSRKGRVKHSLVLQSFGNKVPLERKSFQQTHKRYFKAFTRLFNLQRWVLSLKSAKGRTFKAEKKKKEYAEYQLKAQEDQGTWVPQSVEDQLLISAWVLISGSWYEAPHQASCWAWSLLGILSLFSLYSSPCSYAVFQKKKKNI